MSEKPISEWTKEDFAEAARRGDNEPFIAWQEAQRMIREGDVGGMMEATTPARKRRAKSAAGDAQQEER